MTILQALKNALEMLEAQGITGGDVVDDLDLAIKRLTWKHPAVGNEVL